MDIKIIIAITAAILFSLDFTYDHVIGAFPSDQHNNDDIAQVQRAILDNADPTDLLPPTATGSSDLTAPPSCKTGVIETSSHAQELDSKPYIAYKEGDITYIHVLTLAPIYLRQNAFQLTTADSLKPDHLIIGNLENALTKRSKCDESNLYLAKVTN